MKEEQTEKRIRKKQKLRDAKRRNAKIYPIYKMFSWDLLFFFSIEFLFYTITKGVTASQILIINAFYFIFKVVCQLPAVIITDFIGKRKSIIFANILLIIYILILIFLPGAISIIIGYFFYALGYSIKLNTESNLLYDSVSTKGGDGIYTKLDGRGASLHNILDGMASFIAGFLFVINNYIPLVICLSFLVISTIISIGFKDIYETKNREKKSIKNTLKDYNAELKQAIKFIFYSTRMRAFILFSVVFYSLIKIMAIYRSSLLVSIGIKEEEFSMIYAFLTLIGGVSISLRRSIEKRYKNKTLTVLSLTYIFACITIGFLTNVLTGNIIIPIILMLLVIQNVSKTIWDVLEYKYLKNFTNEESRVKIGFAYEICGSLGASISSFFGGLLLKVLDISNAYLIVGLLFLAIMILTLDYMRTRFGLRPKDYKKKDIEFTLK